MHPTAEKLHVMVKRRLANISLDTVNRTLLTFVRIGLAETIEGYGSPRRYDPNLAPHHHLHCRRCGMVVDFYHDEYDALEIPANVGHEFTNLSKKVVLNGLCDRCQKIDKRHHEGK